MATAALLLARAGIAASLALLACLNGCTFTKDSPINNIDSIGMEAAPPAFEGLRESPGHRHEITGIFPIQAGEAAVWGAAVTVDNSGLALLWDPKSGKQYELARAGLRSGLAAISYGSGLLVLVDGTTPGIFSLGSGRRLAALDRLKSRATSIDLEAGGRSLLVAGADGRVYRWKLKPVLDKNADETRVRTGSGMETYFGHGTVVSAVAFHPAGRVFFSGDWNGVLSAWLSYESDIFGGKYDENVFGGMFFAEKASRVSAGRTDRSGIDFIRISADGQILVLGLQDGGVELWRVRGFVKIGGIRAHLGPLFDLALNQKGDLLATAGRDGLLRTWKINLEPHRATEQAVVLALAQELSLPDVKRLAFLPSGQLLTGSSSGKISPISIKAGSE